MEKKKKIVIIEDEVILRETLQDFLEKEDFDVDSAADGEAGVEMVMRKNPDLVLLDIILPKKNGYEVITELRENQTTKDVPIILLTNLGSIRDIEKALALGATTYLVKADYQLKEIVEKIKGVLEM
ncbi:MAG: Two-component response regulator PhoP [Candidatus Moranbacteria bacterium GW2011_GWE2_35_2-]|nr:MAG: Two-component response regulator PhoP [Candidatus Moranbacteria bacterium GW2011_GWE2_35_2-]KKQ22563.1 MAG: Two-component response regulator PhoP [Candidatus Moranbacteria bacterium GW2011_GWF2_37_11]KKQ28966.1 MAG: Two-component response regulator PhoP [Candidatus Moranbacteria bacterium GW2011_GWD1_37_17]KKQ30498.1 MAG: Two-component response regulator PhoP [Candidatus Moranbacteria bacterium GW2011_GWE1_37_24]KKQ47822.1 MAG: Two-component response regulator PhoP [Candidatus Moranbact